MGLEVRADVRRCSASNRPVPRNGSYPFTPPSKTLSTSSAISHPAARSASSARKRSGRGEPPPRPESESGSPIFRRPNSVRVTARSAALGINDNGDVVGLSGTCGTPDTSALGRHAVLWRNGSVFDLGGLGGTMNNYAIVINNAGWIAGNSDLAGDNKPGAIPATRAVLWRNGAITNLGTLPGDYLSLAQDMNGKGQVVGVSCDVNFNCRPFLWDHGMMKDLNSLFTLGSPQLTFAAGINDDGDIAGTAYDPVTGESPAFLAIPSPAAQIAGDSVKKMMLPANVRASLQRRLRLRPIGGRTTAQQ
jgi:probable HAF family extracellular repeat protein